MIQFTTPEPNPQGASLVLNCGYHMECGNLVREGGFEPPYLAAPAPKAGVSTIPPLAHDLDVL